MRIPLATTGLLPLLSALAVHAEADPSASLYPILSPEHFSKLFGDLSASGATFNGDCLVVGRAEKLVPHDHGWLYMVDVPGLRNDDITVTGKGHILTIEGEHLCSLNDPQCMPRSIKHTKRVDGKSVLNDLKISHVIEDGVLHVQIGSPEGKILNLFEQAKGKFQDYTYAIPNWFSSKKTSAKFGRKIDAAVQKAIPEIAQKLDIPEDKVQQFTDELHASAQDLYKKWSKGDINAANAIKELNGLSEKVWDDMSSRDPKVVSAIEDQISQLGKKLGVPESRQQELINQITSNFTHVYALYKQNGFSAVPAFTKELKEMCQNSWTQLKVSPEAYGKETASAVSDKLTDLLHEVGVPEDKANEFLHKVNTESQHIYKTVQQNGAFDARTAHDLEETVERLWAESGVDHVTSDSIKRFVERLARRSGISNHLLSDFSEKFEAEVTKFYKAPYSPTRIYTSLAAKAKQIANEVHGEKLVTDFENLIRKTGREMGIDVDEEEEFVKRLSHDTRDILSSLKRGATGKPLDFPEIKSRAQKVFNDLEKEAVKTGKKVAKTGAEKVKEKLSGHAQEKKIEAAKKVKNPDGVLRRLWSSVFGPSKEAREAAEAERQAKLKGKSFANQAWDAVAPHASKAVNQAKAKATAAADYVKGTAKDAQTAKAYADAKVKKSADAANGVLNNIIKSSQTYYQSASQKIFGFFESTADRASRAADNVVDGAGRVKQEAGSKYKNAKEDVSAKIGAVKKSVAGQAEKVKEGVQGVAGKIYGTAGKVKEGIHNAKESVNEKVEDVIDSVEETAEGIAEKAGHVKDFIKQAATAQVSHAKGKVDDAKQAIEDAKAKAAIKADDATFKAKLAATEVAHKAKVAATEAAHAAKHKADEASHSLKVQAAKATHRANQKKYVREDEDGNVRLPDTLDAVWSFFGIH